MERFAWLVVLGGLGVLAGLWLARLQPLGLAPWVGYGLAGGGAVALATGIADGLAWPKRT